MSTLWWVRHGPTHQKAFTGWRDVPADLTDEDRLDRLRNYLPEDALLISSDLIRCVATADAIQGARTRLPHDRDLREFDFGDWDGLHFSEVAERDAVLSRAYWETPGDVAPPNGESWNQAEARALGAVTRLREAHPVANIIIVSHFGIILSQLRIALRIPAAEILAQKIDNLSVTRIPEVGEPGPINHCP